MMGKEFYSVTEVVEIINLSRDRIYEYLRRGQLQGARIGSHGAWRIPATEIERLKSPGSLNHKKETKPPPQDLANISLAATRLKYSLSQISPKDWAIWGLRDTGEPPLTSEAGTKIWMDRGQPVVTLTAENDDNFPALILYLGASFPELGEYDTWRQSITAFFRICWNMAREILSMAEEKIGLPLSPLPVMGKGHLVNVPKYIYEFALDNYRSGKHPDLEILPDNARIFRLTVKGYPDYVLAIGSHAEMERCSEVTITLANQFAQDERFGQIKAKFEEFKQQSAPIKAILTEITKGKPLAES